MRTRWFERIASTASFSAAGGMLRGLSIRRTRGSTAAYCSTSDRVRSVDPPSATSTSRSRWVWPSTESRQAEIDRSSSSAGMTTVTRPSSVTGRSPTATQEGRDGAQRDDQVAPWRPVLDVAVAEPDPGLDRGVAPVAVDLRPPGDADRHPVAIAVAVDLGGELLDEVRALGPGTDDGHVAADHVEQLRQLVEVGLAKHVADLGDALVVVD